jgi:hypothetical protein
MELVASDYQFVRCTPCCLRILFQILKQPFITLAACTHTLAFVVGFIVKSDLLVDADYRILWSWRLTAGPNDLEAKQHPCKRPRPKPCDSARPSRGIVFYKAQLPDADIRPSLADMIVTLLVGMPRC